MCGALILLQDHLNLLGVIPKPPSFPFVPRTPFYWYLSPLPRSRSQPASRIRFGRDLPQQSVFSFRSATDGVGWKGQSAREGGCLAMTAPASGSGHIRLCAAKIPRDAAVANTCKIPLGAVVEPFSRHLEQGVKRISVPSAAHVARCSNCFALASPFCDLRRGPTNQIAGWRCALCGTLNAPPATKEHENVLLGQTEAGSGSAELRFPPMSETGSRPRVQNARPRRRLDARRGPARPPATRTGRVFAGRPAGTTSPQPASPSLPTGPPSGFTGSRFKPAVPSLSRTPSPQGCSPGGTPRAQIGCSRRGAPGGLPASLRTPMAAPALSRVSSAPCCPSTPTRPTAALRRTRGRAAWWGPSPWPAAPLPSRAIGPAGRARASRAFWSWAEGGALRARAQSPALVTSTASSGSSSRRGRLRPSPRRSAAPAHASWTSWGAVTSPGCHGLYQLTQNTGGAC